MRVRNPRDHSRLLMKLGRILCFAVFAALLSFADEPKPDYMPKPLEFPPLNSARRIDGELVTLDFYHRKGQFRTASGELTRYLATSSHEISKLT